MDSEVPALNRGVAACFYVYGLVLAVVGICTMLAGVQLSPAIIPLVGIFVLIGELILCIRPNRWNR